MTDIRRMEPLSRAERALALLLTSARAAVGPDLDWVRDPDIHISFAKGDDLR